MPLPVPAGLGLVQKDGAQERWLAVLVTTSRSGSPSVRVVNAGVPAHPLTRRRRTLGFVARGGTAKLRNLRAIPAATMAAERRTAVLLESERFSTNPPGSEHQEQP